jgi:hypothetical protein
MLGTSEKRGNSSRVFKDHSKTLIVASEVLGLKRMLRAFAPSASLFKVGVEALIKQKPADWRIRIGD